MLPSEKWLRVFPQQFENQKVVSFTLQVVIFHETHVLKLFMLFHIFFVNELLLRLSYFFVL